MKLIFEGFTYRYKQGYDKHLIVSSRSHHYVIYYIFCVNCDFDEKPVVGVRTIYIGSKWLKRNLLLPSLYIKMHKCKVQSLGTSGDAVLDI